MTDSLPSTIVYVCACGYSMVVSVPYIDQKRDETKTCEECGEEAPWDEFTVDFVDGPEPPSRRPIP